MLLGKQDSKIEYDQLSQYIEGWLHYKENKKYERFWFALRGNVIHGRDLCTAYLFCFKDLNIHVDANVVGSVEIHPHDKVELLKCGGNKPMKCDFTILLSETKFHFRADDEISRERWIYALCDLIGKCQPPSELPTERNQIRASIPTSQKKKENDKKSAFHRSRTVELPTTRGAAALAARRKSTPLSSTSASASRSSLLRSQTVDSVDCAPVEPPPRSVCSLPFMLDPHTQLENLEWFYPGMKREEAQEKLSTCPVGYYLLRDSESKVGSYTLTFRDAERIKNHMITQSSDRLYRFHNSEVETAFPSPHKAVEFYMIKKHSKTLTPVPYCGNCDGGDRDYLLPSEMNVTSEPSQMTQVTPISPISPSQIPNPSGGYTHRQLPPTPDAGAVKSLSIDDAEDYLTIRDDKPNDYTQRAPTDNKDSSKMKYNGVKRSHSTADDDSNGYLKVEAPSSYDDPINDNESYVEVIDPVRCGEESGEDSDSNSDPEYFEYEKYGGSKANSKYINTEPFDRGPTLPEKPPTPSKCQFSTYDSVNLQDYENQNVIDSAPADPPPIPPRSSKPELPPRRETSYRT